MEPDGAQRFIALVHVGTLSLRVRRPLAIRYAWVRLYGFRPRDRRWRPSI
jgi:hypothetical protein